MNADERKLKLRSYLRSSAARTHRVESSVKTFLPEDLPDQVFHNLAFAIRLGLSRALDRAFTPA
jgi:hypothetical protein